MYTRLTVLVWLLCSLHNGIAAQPASGNKYALFASLPANTEAAAMQAQSLYDSLLRYNKDSVYVLGQLGNLLSRAHATRQPALQSMATSLLADHYARLRQLNPLSTGLHKTAVSIAEDHQLALPIALAKFKLGRYYFSFRQYPVAFEHLLQAEEWLAKSSSAAALAAMAEYRFYMGAIYQQINDLDNAKKYLLGVLQHTPEKKWYLINTLDNLASIYQQQQRPDSAGIYLLALQKAVSDYQFTSWEGLSQGNLGKHYYAQGRYAQALPLLQKAAERCASEGNAETAISYYALLGQYAIAQNNWEDAAGWLQKMDTTVRYNSRWQSLVFYYALAGPVAEARQNFKAAAYAYKRLEEARDSVQMQRSDKAVRDVGIKMETARHLSSLAALEAEAGRKLMIRNALLLAAALLLGLGYWFYRRKLERQKLILALSTRQQELLMARQQLVEEELSGARRQLHLFTEHVREKNAMIEEFTRQVQAHKVQEQQDERIKMAQTLQESTILTPHQWDEFKQLFEKVYPGFFLQLREKYPAFTAAETRLLALLKLGLNAGEMASMMGVGLDSVKKTRHRIRKKLPWLAEDQRLEDFIASLDKAA